MKKKLSIALAAGVTAATVGLGAAGAVSAAPNAKGACVQDGIGFLKANGLLQAAAQKQIDYRVQVVALGDGIFRAIEYFGGLPGAGWDGGHRVQAESETVIR